MNKIVKRILITSLSKIRGFIVNDLQPAFLRRHVFQRFRMMLLNHWRSLDFWRPGRVITQVAPKRNYEFSNKSQLFIEFPCVFLSII